MHGQRVGCTCVSSFDQNPERQPEGVAVDRVLTDKALRQGYAVPGAG